MQKKSTSSSASFRPRTSIALLLCAAPLLIAVGTLPAFLKPQAPPNASQGTLTFEERVSYQRAIEDVYWRHRIWPTENSDPKPPPVMSQTQIERKVKDYLCNSQALEHYWHRPITAEQLQAEMDRMAQHSKQPEVLQELFDVIANDPFVIAECLARPVLADRLLIHSATDEQLEQASRTSSKVEAATTSNTMPSISNPVSGCTDDTWTATTQSGAPDGRDFHTAIWTGVEMIVWGGGDNVNGFNTGGR